MWQSSWYILCDTAIYILVGFAIAGVLHVWIAGGRAIRWLSERRPRSVFLATMVGVPLPLCSCGVLPSAVMLRRKGASKGATLSFLISTPETSVTSILLTYSLLGPLMAVFRPIAACITALTAGFVENFLDRRSTPESTSGQAGESGNASDACADERHQHTPATVMGLKGGLRYAFVDLFDDIFFWIVLGILAAAAIQGLLPGTVLRAFFSDAFTSMLLMLVIGIPLYICAESSTPIAAALIAQGMNPGAALVLLLVGPATNLGAVGVLYRELGRRTVINYLATVAIVALLMGGVLNLLTAWFPLTLTVRAFGEPLVPQWLKVTGAIAFLVLGLFTVRRRRYWPRLIAWLDAKLPVRVTQRRLLTGAGVLAVLAYLASGFFTVRPGEIGVVRRFGAIVRPDIKPGLRYAWPYPIDQVDRVPVRRVNRLVLGFVDAPQDPLNPATDPGESWLLIGDENIADIKTAVHWGAKPDQMIDFQYGVAQRQALVRDVALGACREVLGGSSISRVFTAERYACEAKIAALIQQRLDGYRSGIRIDSFHFLDAHAPPDVHESFRDVASALEDKSTQINLARRDENQIVPLARGKAEGLREAAAGYAATTVSWSKGESQRFIDVLRVYEQWKRVTRQRMYFETLDAILPGIRKYIKTTGPGAGEIEIWLVDPRVGGGAPWQPGADMR
jgi:HflK protein